jgi:hypothetical protein
MVIIDQDSGILVEADVTAVFASCLFSGANDDALDD